MQQSSAWTFVLTNASRTNFVLNCLKHVKFLRFLQDLATFFWGGGSSRPPPQAKTFLRNELNSAAGAVSLDLNFCWCENCGDFVVGWKASWKTDDEQLPHLLKIEPEGSHMPNPTALWTHRSTCLMLWPWHLEVYTRKSLDTCHLAIRKMSSSFFMSLSDLLQILGFYFHQKKSSTNTHFDKNLCLVNRT